MINKEPEIDATIAPNDALPHETTAAATRDTVLHDEENIEELMAHVTPSATGACPIS